MRDGGLLLARQHKAFEENFGLFFNIALKRPRVRIPLFVGRSL